MMANRLSSKGPDLEEALKSYFWRAGYFVVRGLPFRLDDEDITDVDLWLYERPAALTRRRLIVDAKNRKSPKATERIIWAKGLQEALKVDGVIVATTDQRQSAKRLSSRTGVVLLDGEAVSKLLQSDKLKSDQIGSDELDSKVKAIDEARRTGDWRQTLYQARASLLSGFGVQSINQSLRACGFFAEQAVVAQPRSDSAIVATRLFYLTSAFAAVSIDYVLASHAFQSQDERRRLLVHGIRFGHSDALPAFSTVRAAIGLVRQYLENGNAIARQIETAFDADAHKIPAELIADYVARISTTEALFNAAREIERAAYSSTLPNFDNLSAESRSLLGVFLDFNGVSREKFATAVERSGRNISNSDSPAVEARDVGPLFVKKEA